MSTPEQPIDLSIEAPLAALIAKPRHLMSDSELRERITKLHEQRVSSQTFHAAVKASVRQEKEVKPTAAAFEGFED